MPEPLALYRKYRPQSFAEVIGQDHIVKTLEGALGGGQVAHAYLFAGSRGTGKTSVARILARALGTAPEDLYEIDGASSRGVDEIRELREAVRTSPFISRYKVYIIDEVHMLTREAFNALLKTLEEPPAHVIFILATTEAHKLPETIVSRCQVFTFRRPTLAELAQVAAEAAAGEGFKIEPAAAELLALLADGSYRDALGALQKALAVSADRKIVRTEIEAVLGAPRASLVRQLVVALLDGELAPALAAVREVVAANQTVKLFLKLVLRDLRLAMLQKYAPAVAAPLLAAAGVAAAAELRQLAAHPRAGELPNILRELLVAYEEIDRSYLPELPLELALVRLLAPDRLVYNEKQKKGGDDR